jgi:hypothetical protein
MSEIDYALAWDFIGDADGKPRQLRFRQNYAPPDDPRIFDGTGQLIAVIADRHRTDNGDEIAISQPNVSLAAVEAAIEGWQDWATLYIADNGIDRAISLAAIRRRIEAAGLAYRQPH